MKKAPKVPTTGWMLSELGRLGLDLRGTETTDKRLVELLRARGYDVYESRGKERASNER